MYLVGNFQRIPGAAKPLYQVEKLKEISKEHLIKAKQDENYQVINLETGEYFDPELNKWIEI